MSGSVSARMREHVRQNVVGYIALFCFVIGGTAVALPGKNKVDSGDIKAGQVKRGDIGTNAVDSSKVADESLTGADVNEGSLNLPAAPTTLPPSGPASGDLSGEYPNPELRAGTVGDAETADRERRIAISAGSMTGTTSLGFQSSFAVQTYPADANTFANASAEVPTDRVPGTPMELRLLWRAISPGDVVWVPKVQPVAVGGSVIAGQISLSGTGTATAANTLQSTSFTIPGTVENGSLLGISAERSAAAADTAGGVQLFVAEIRNTATG